MLSESDLERLVARLKQEEGFRAFPYTDTTGNLTIGYGTNLTAGISPLQADALLRVAISEINTELQRYSWFTGLDTLRQLVLLDMAYNMGVANLLGFQEMIQAIEMKNFSAAADQMLNSLWARQVGERAIRLAEVMRTGQWNE